MYPLKHTGIIFFKQTRSKSQILVCLLRPGIIDQRVNSLTLSKEDLKIKRKLTLHICILSYLYTFS